MILSINYEIKNNTNNYLNHFKQQQLLNIEEVLSIDNMFDTTAKLIKCKVCLFNFADNSPTEHRNHYNCHTRNQYDYYYVY